MLDRQNNFWGFHPCVPRSRKWSRQHFKPSSFCQSQYVEWNFTLRDWWGNSCSEIDLFYQWENWIISKVTTIINKRIWSGRWRRTASKIDELIVFREIDRIDHLINEFEACLSIDLKIDTCQRRYICKGKTWRKISLSKHETKIDRLIDGRIIWWLAKLLIAQLIDWNNW